MMKNAIVFVDANNWYHNVKHWFKPGDIDIVKVSEFICEKFGYKLKEIRWYASVPSIKDGEAMFYKHLSFLSHLEKKGVKVITRKLQTLSNKEILKKKRDILDNLDLCETCRPLVESTFLDLADIKRKEKGIDVWIAVDMIRLGIIENEYDVCILISGDADFTPALELIDKEKDILSVFVPQGYAYELRDKFHYFILKKSILRQCFDAFRKRKI